MGKAEDELLQRYFDGELPADERARVEATLTEDDRLRLAALGEMNELIGHTLLAEAEASELDLWPALEKQLAGDNNLSRARWRRWMRAHTASISAGVASLAAAAALLFVFQPWHAQHPDNDCDVVSLETSGAVATVFNMNDVPHGGDGPTTVIWTEEQD